MTGVSAAFLLYDDDLIGVVEWCDWQRGLQECIIISFPYNVICCIVCSKSRALHGESPLVKGDLKRSYPKDPHSSSHSNSSSKSNSISPHPAGSQQHAHNPYSQSRCVYQVTKKVLSTLPKVGIICREFIPMC